MHTHTHTHTYIHTYVEMHTYRVIGIQMEKCQGTNGKWTDSTLQVLICLITLYTCICMYVCMYVCIEPAHMSSALQVLICSGVMFARLSESQCSRPDVSFFKSASTPHYLALSDLQSSIHTHTHTHKHVYIQALLFHS